VLKPNVVSLASDIGSDTILALGTCANTEAVIETAAKMKSKFLSIYASIN
jgi:hypothetical protein